MKENNGEYMNLKFKEANVNQLEAIQSTEGPLLIIAGPGTGKTYTLINRALNLIVNKKVDPSKILFATFTEKAAHELITRLSNALNEVNIDFNPNEMYIGTFHSICLKILKDNISYSNLKKNFNLKDQFEQQYFIYQHYYEFKNIEGFDNVFSTGSIWDKCEDICKSINRLVEELIDINELLNSTNINFQFYGRLVQKYESLRIDNNFLDFSSIQTETYKMLMNYQEIREKVLNSIDYVMVDEYQDTNHIQEKLSILFSSKKNNLCVVGDDDQAIYRFRGATVRNILEFPAHFSNCKKVSLVDNYRSHKDIVSFYNLWMNTTCGKDYDFTWDKYRYTKKIMPSKEHKCEQPAVIQCSTKEKDYINQKIYNQIIELMESGKINNYNQIAFLFRSVKSDYVKSLSDFLENKGIPVYSPRSNMFFERHEIKLLLGSLLLVFPTYLAKMKNGEVDRNMLEYYLSCLEEVKNDLKKEENKELYSWLQHRAKDHMFIAESLDYGFSALMYRILEYEPFASFLDVDLTKGVNDTRTTRNIGLFIKLLVKFEFLNKISIITSKNISKAIDRLFNQYLKFLYEGGITEYEDESEYAPSGCVSFMTIHQSKGMEFPIVFVGSQNAVPRKQYDDDLEEIIVKYSGRGKFEEKEMMKIYDFWRLYYVAFSRAQSLLVLICDMSKKGEPSKYFDYIYDIVPHKTDISQFEFEQIKNSNIKNSYSFTSDINAYLVCPTQYKYFKELGFEAVRVGQTMFGSLVHETIEDIHKTVIRGEIQDVTKENIEKWFNINYQTLSKANNAYLDERIINAALEQVNSYVEKASQNWDIIKNAEMPISLTQRKYIITGKVDLVLNDKGNYEILDFKTEKKPKINKETEKVDRVRKQLEIYSYLIEKRYGITISGMKVYYTSEKNGNPYLSFRKDDKHIKETINEFDQIVEKIEKKKFIGQCCDLTICKNCDLRFYCKRR